MFLPASSCADLYKFGQTNSGVYTVDPDGSGAFDVFCDQTTDGGGWTVFQKRINGSVDFYRYWADYKNGFSNLNGEFWLGLDKIHRLANSDAFELRVDLEDWQGGTRFAKYTSFAISNEATKYKLSLDYIQVTQIHYYITFMLRKPGQLSFGRTAHLYQIRLNQVSRAVITTNVTERTFWPHSIHSHVSPSHPLN